MIVLDLFEKKTRIAWCCGFCEVKVREICRLDILIIYQGAGTEDGGLIGRNENDVISSNRV